MDAIVIWLSRLLNLVEVDDGILPRRDALRRLAVVNDVALLRAARHSSINRVPPYCITLQIE